MSATKILWGQILVVFDALDYMDDHFGGPYQYLAKHHLDPQVVEQLRGSLVT